jgi:NADH dehydrogenase
MESAEKAPDAETRAAWMTFVVVGGGPTGVELAGTLAELTHSAMKREFRHISQLEPRILLVEAGEHILAAYPADLQEKAVERLKKLGVTILTKQAVQGVTQDKVTIAYNEHSQEIATQTILWTAGVKASPLGGILTERTGCPTDKGGRIRVNPDCSVPGHPEIFVIGDLAEFSHTRDGKPLPGLAAVAMQQGQYVARVIRDRLAHQQSPAFRYRDKGNLAIIGRNAAIAQIGHFHLSGFLAWLVWLVVHIYYLVGFDNKVLVTFQWAWNYLTFGRSACLITE